MFIVNGNYKIHGTKAIRIYFQIFFNSVSNFFRLNQ
jgi:hypothetical protein